MIICPECKKEQNDTAPYCTNCGYVFNTKPKFNYEANKQTYIKIAVSIILIVVALSLVTSSEFTHYVENVSYYAEQYASTKSQSSGFLGSSYASLASKWNDMYNKAVTYIALHSIGATVASIVGGLGLYRNLKKLKNGGETNNGIN